MIGEPTTAQIARTADVARQVAEWRAGQTDLIKGKCGMIRKSACDEHQSSFLHESRTRFSGEHCVHVDVRFLVCQGCERFHRIANPEATISNFNSRFTKRRYKVRVKSNDDR